MKIRIKEPVEHDGKPLTVGKVVDLPKEQAESLIACGAAEDPEAAAKAAAKAKADAEAAANEQDELKAKARAFDDMRGDLESLGIGSPGALKDVAGKAKSWDDVQTELEQLRAKAAAYDALPEDVRAPKNG